MNIGLYFGSFNPIHVGHMIIANHLVENSNLDEIWFVVTPHNPLKKKKTLLDDYLRLDLVQKAIKPYITFRASDIEFKLKTPNYTYITLALLKEKYSMHDFSLIMGEDNLGNFHKWKNNENIIDNHKIYVYPRPNVVKTKYHDYKNVTVVDAPLIEISATNIRKQIKAGKNVRPLLPEGIYDYIDEQNLYK